MSSIEHSKFLDHLYKLNGNPLFVEFLQQLFPWVSSMAAADSASGNTIGTIRWATEEISRVLYAAHSDNEGFLRLVRSTSDRPRCSWSQLLHGQNQNTTRIHAKTTNFILDVFSFARPERRIQKYSCHSASHHNGIFDGCWVLQHEDFPGSTAGGAAAGPTSPDCPSLVDETLVYLHVESPNGQSHLEPTQRDVIIKMTVMPAPEPERHDNDAPNLCSSSSDEFTRNLQPTIRETSWISDCIVPMSRQNAMSFRSDYKDQTECTSSVASDSSHLEDHNLDEDSMEVPAEVVAQETMSATACKLPMLLNSHERIQATACKLPMLLNSHGGIQISELQVGNLQIIQTSTNLVFPDYYALLQAPHTAFLDEVFNVDGALSTAKPTNPNLPKFSLTLDCGSEMPGAGAASPTKVGYSFIVALFGCLVFAEHNVYPGQNAICSCNRAAMGQNRETD